MSANMRRYRFAAGRRFLGVVLACALLPAQTLAQEPCATPSGRVVSVQGLVEISRAGEPRWQPASLDDSLCANDRVRVEAKGRAAIRLANETTIRLDRGTTITFPAIEREERSWVQILKGALHFISRVPKSLDIRTPYVNAAIEGTELAVSVREGETAIWVFEGQVRATNAQGELVLVGGDSAVAKAGEAPQRRIVVKQRDVVQWALYYPPVVDYREALRTEKRESVIGAIERFRAGNVLSAFLQLEETPDSARDEAFYILRASMSLSIGDVEAAQSDLTRGVQLNRDSAGSRALKSTIALARGDAAEAGRLANEALASSPNSPVANVAASYVLQSRFELEGARRAIQTAIEFAPEDGLAWARLSELELAADSPSAAKTAAETAVALNPKISRTQTVLGFARLAGGQVKDAAESFRTAVELDQGDPLPRLGLGFALIRRGELETGREHIESAASLDPRNSVVRSYLGKAYFEEQREHDAASQLSLAKTLDPNDPTPWLYDAIRKVAENRPIEALSDLRESINRNNNRAVYRSSLQLDDDAAVRGITLGRVFQDLGFEERGLLEGMVSLQRNPTNPSSHRFLADSYQSLPRHEISRVSELMQSQLLNHDGIVPTQPQRVESNLAILNGSGPAGLTFNEYSSVFERDGIELFVDGVAGSNSTLSDSVVALFQEGAFALSASQFHYESDGFRQNNDQETDIYSALLHTRITPSLSAQLEVRSKRLEFGDLELRFFEEPSPLNRRRITEDSARLGLSFKPNARTTILASGLVQTRANEVARFIGPIRVDATAEGAGSFGETQVIRQFDSVDLIVGAGKFADKVKDFTTVTGPAGPRTLPTTRRSTSHANAYGYFTWHADATIDVTIGASFDDYKDRMTNESKVRPKAGFIWRPMDRVTVRGAALKVLRRPLFDSRTLEPTQVGGFNQFFDNVNGTSSRRFGLGVDVEIANGIFVGVEATKIDADVPFNLGGIVGAFDERERTGRAYLNWAPSVNTALSASYLYDDYEGNQPNAVVTKLRNHEVSIGARFFMQHGLRFGLSATYVDQIAKRNADKGEDNFLLIDADVGYVLPKRLGIARLKVKNLFDEEFRFQDRNFQSSQPRDLRFVPERTVLFEFSTRF